MTRFDLATADLATGSLCLEASAGTGKTYTITGLVVRLVAELDLKIEEILVVTFTEAATDELRERLRGGLESAIDACSDAPTREPDAYLAGWAELEASELLRRRGRLQTALERFDRAAVTTIHGFCSRVLREDPIRTGAPVGFENAGDQSALFARSFEEFWRDTVYDSDPLLLAWFELADVRRSLRQRARSMLTHRGLEIRPEPRSLQEVRAERQSLWRDFVARAREVPREFWSGLKLTSPLTKALFVQAGSPAFTALVDEIFDHLEDDRLGCAEATTALQFFGLLFDERKAQKRLTAELSKVAPAEEFRAFVSSIEDEVDALLPSLRASILTRLQHEKSQRGALSFDDLLDRVARALEPRRDGAPTELAEILRGKFRAALIDEFQDTDEVQWSIFRALFQTGEHHLYLIGDPKQAIYGFRGADLATYLQAVDTCATTARLEHNYRSSDGMVRAVNAVFEEHPDPFTAAIEYHPVDAAKQDLGECQGPDDCRPLHFVVGSFQVVQLVEATARSIQQHLLESTLDGRPLRFEDCAVLTRTRGRAEAIRDRLEELGIPTRTRKLGSVLESAYAEELLAVARAIQSPSRGSIVRRFLASPLCGAPSDRHPALTGDDQALDDVVSRLERAQRTWQRYGFAAACESVLETFDCRSWIASTANGARNLTDLDHLIEWFGQQGHSHIVDAELLARSLAEELDPDEDSATETPPRLCSENGVQILTMHSSKGLEFELVFCVDLGARPSKKSWSTDGLYRATLDDETCLVSLREDPNGRRRGAVASSELAEELRLAYVALTRAKRRCVVLLNLPKSFEAPAASPAEHLFLTNVSTPTADGVLEHLRNLSPKISATGLEDLLEGGPMAMSDRQQLDPDLLVARSSSLGANIPMPWRRTSFTAIASGEAASAGDVLGAFDDDARPFAVEDELAPEREGLAAEPVEVPPETSPDLEKPSPSPAGLHAFQAGAGAGQCLHDLLESADLAHSDIPSNRELIARLLSAHGLDEPSAHREAIDPVETCVDLLRNVAGIRWPGAAETGFAAVTDLAPEWRFTLETDGRRERDLAQALESNSDDPMSPWQKTARAMRRLAAAPLRGFLTGSIDRLLEIDGRVLVVDWKSNRLGDDAEAYGRKALDEAMVEHLYPLQAALYELAVLRFLRARQPEIDPRTRLAGTCYVFLRGLDGAEPGHGLWVEPSDFERLERLDAILGGGR